MSRNKAGVPKMNLTSLMDVFTILVFFLLVNSGSVELVEAPKDVKLPESFEESKPRETVVISVSHGRSVWQLGQRGRPDDTAGNRLRVPHFAQSTMSAMISCAR